MLHKGVELLGEGHQVVLPTPNSPDDRYWVITPEELNWEISQPHPWLVKLLKQKKTRSRTCSRRARKVPEKPALGRALDFYLEHVLPYATEVDSNHPRLLAAAIIAHQVDGRKNQELLGALRCVNKELPPEERVSSRELAAIARCVQRNGYGFNPSTYAARTGTDPAIARKICSFWGRIKHNPVYMSRKHFDQRIRRVIWFRGQPVAPGVRALTASEAEISRLAGVSQKTLQARRLRDALPPFVTAYTKVGREGAVTLLYALGNFAWSALGISEIENTQIPLSNYKKGVNNANDLARKCRERWGYEARAGPRLGLGSAFCW